MIAPATSPAPTPHPQRRNCTDSTLAGAAFLSASAPVIGAADATFANEYMLVVRTIAAANLPAVLSIRLPPFVMSPDRIIVRVGAGLKCAIVLEMRKGRARIVRKPGANVAGLRWPAFWSYRSSMSRQEGAMQVRF